MRVRAYVWGAMLTAGLARGLLSRSNLLARGGSMTRRLLSSSRGVGEGEDVVKLPTPLGDLSTAFVAEDRDAYLFGEQMERQTFRQLGVEETLCKALERCGKTTATSIQSKSFPIILSGTDVVVGAETGSGKTLSYLVPLIQKCCQTKKQDAVGDVPSAEEKRKYPSVVVMVPNKELCVQVLRMAQELVSTMKEEGGQSVEVRAATDRWSLSDATDILICTPRFLSGFVKGGHATEPDMFRAVRHLVLDEADMLLEGSYLPDVERVLDAFKFIRREMIGEGQVQVHESILQHILSAATLPSYGLRSIERYIERRYPRAIKVSNSHLHKHHPRIEQKYIKMSDVRVASTERIEAITQACVTEESTMIFANTAEEARQLADALRASNVECAEFHKLNENRQEELRQFREGKVKIIICTDSAARGLDLPNVRHVIQAQFALNVVQHLHRIGRSSRAGASGRATCLFDSSSDILVDSIRTGSSVEGSFSRRRGLRKKWKKIHQDPNSVE